MKSKCIKHEKLFDGSSVVIVETHLTEPITIDFPGVSFSCYVIPIQQHSEPEILLQNSTLEECELAFVETLENDLCDI